jgi:1-acyl-sn-glycerol-3-phosphate acyltransferase
VYSLIAIPLTLILRIYFRHVEVVGLHRIPAEGPVIFVLNHPNGLVDPVVILCYSPRQITFLGKEPVFKMFFIGWVARMIEAIPVYRQQDESGGLRSSGIQQKNQITFDKVRKLLSEGKSIAIFPEGVSHSDTKLKPLKSGAARIALGSNLENLKIVPAGLYYTEKREFRSSVLLYFGEPFGLPPIAEVGTPAEPDRLAVRAVTERIKEALDEVTLQAEHPDALRFIERAERIFTAGRSSSEIASGSQREVLPWANRRLRRRFIVKRQFMARFQKLKTEAPEQVAALEGKIRAFEEKLAAVGLKPEDLLPNATRPASVALGSVIALLRFAALPLVVLGVVTHYAVYRLIGVLAIKFAKQEDDLISTIKVISAMAIYPVTWLILAALVWRFLGPLLGLFALGVIPLSGYAALMFVETLRSDLGHARAIWLLVTRGAFYQELRSEQIAIREQILSLDK